jgi:uncharacterized membrane protein YuzA (DUF378 family)
MMRNFLFNLALLLVVVGAINWALTALDMNLVKMLSMGNVMVENGVYYAVAIAGIYLAFEIYRMRENVSAALYENKTA